MGIMWIESVDTEFNIKRRKFIEFTENTLGSAIIAIEMKCAKKVLRKNKKEKWGNKQNFRRVEKSV